MNVELFYPILLESSGVCIDSREVVEGSVFFAFTGSSFNAAQNARQAIDRGQLPLLWKMLRLQHLRTRSFE